jgi:hypothetical protein
LKGSRSDLDTTLSNSLKEFSLRLDVASAERQGKLDKLSLSKSMVDAAKRKSEDAYGAKKDAWRAAFDLYKEKLDAKEAADRLAAIKQGKEETSGKEDKKDAKTTYNDIGEQWKKLMNISTQLKVEGKASKNTPQQLATMEAIANNINTKAGRQVIDTAAFAPNEDWFGADEKRLAAINTALKSAKLPSLEEIQGMPQSAVPSVNNNAAEATISKRMANTGMSRDAVIQEGVRLGKLPAGYK